MKGYYSLIQYAENPDRVEYVNIGVVVFSDGGKRLSVKFAESPSRIKKVFGVTLGSQYGMLKESFSHRLNEEFSSWDSLSDIEYFVSNRASKIRMTPLRAVLIKDIEVDANDLFSKLVGVMPKVQPRQRVNYKLKSLLQKENVESMLQAGPSPVEINQFSIKPDYGYQNGKYNYIKSVSLIGEPNEALGKVSLFALTGKMLSEMDSLSPKRLVIVGDDEGQDIGVVREITDVLKDNSVVFYSMQSVDPLIADIKLNAIKNRPSTTFS